MKKKVFISIGILAVIIIVLACVLTKCMSGKTTDTDTTEVSTNSDADIAKADSVAEATTEKQNATTTEKTKETNDSHDVEAGVTKPTTEHTTEAPEPSTQAPAKPEPTSQAPRTEAPTTEYVPPTAEAPTEHVHDWKTVAYTETIHHDEVWETHYYCGCGQILDNMSAEQVKQHTITCGSFCSGECSKMTQPAWDEEVTHHRRVCSCGAKEEID